MTDHLDLELVKRLIRGDLDAPTTRDVENHVDECAACRRMVAEERAFQETLALDEAPEGDSATLKKLLHRVDEAPVGGSPPRMRRRIAAVALGGVGVIGLMATLAAFWPVEDPNERLAADLGISTRRQAAIVAELDELQTLAKEPWLADRYQTVVAVDLLTERAP
jgi:anti-sigma factor RsiW